MRRKRNDLEKESNNLSIIVVLALFLICSLGYIAYDKYFSKLGEEPEKEKAIEKVVYNKDGVFIKSLMKNIIIHTGISHTEFQLYAKDKVTVNDLDEMYRNSLVVDYIGKTSFTKEELKEASIAIFGKNIYASYPTKLEKICKTYILNESGVYSQDPQSGGCGGAGYRYYDAIEDVDSDENHIYVYQRVGFQCEEGVCKELEKGEYGYTGKTVVKKLSNPITDEVQLNEIQNELPLYKFTFTYDNDNNIYYFESVEKEK